MPGSSGFASSHVWDPTDEARLQQQATRGADACIGALHRVADFNSLGVAACPGEGAADRERGADGDHCVRCVRQSRPGRILCLRRTEAGELLRFAPAFELQRELIYREIRNR
ncbi:hypothetical protein DIPPA_08922 [Diplonema papillatum]|nr:hypothetical protein DIPPA_08922 [Diplonema papillatum]